MPKRKVVVPPIVVQGVGYKCWAAALESWLRITPNRRVFTMNELLGYAMPLRTGFDVTLDKKGKEEPMPPGAINARIFKVLLEDNFLNLRMEYQEFPGRGSVPDETFCEYLAYYQCHLYVVYTPGNANTDIRHANVVYSADEEGNLEVMDPQAGMIMKKTASKLGSPMLIGWRDPTSSILESVGYS